MIRWLGVRDKSGIGMAKKSRSPLDWVPQMFSSAERTSRSSALAPHNWFFAFGTALVLGGGALGLGAWVLATGLFVVVVSTGSFVWTNQHFARNNPDALRTEKFNLEKMALQKQLVGDDKKGITETIADDDLDRENAIDVGTKTLDKGTGESS
jgi:hypothetical protein